MGFQNGLDGKKRVIDRYSPSSKVVFLFDVDNTLLDNDRVLDDLRNHLEQEFGAETRDRYFAILEELYVELGYADYLGALQRYRLEDMCDPRLLLMSSFLVDYPFANRLHPDSLAALAHVRQRGATVILSDGDGVFQPRKVQRSGLWEAVEGRVLIYIHKEQMFGRCLAALPSAALRHGGR
jgi:FMN phosphatase YigB (HAD superfamily)